MADIIVYSEQPALVRELMSAAAVIAGPLGLEVQAFTLDQAEIIADTAAAAQAVQAAAGDAEYILLASNRRGRELAGRLAQNIGAGCLTDVARLSLADGAVVGERNATGGATVACQVITSARKVFAISPRSYAPAEGGAITPLDTAGITPTVAWQGMQPKSGGAADIEAAAVLVAVGMGLEDQSDLPAVQAIAQALGGEVACSKPVATDRKWLSEELVIGLSGKKCQPTLAILLGISGQVQFNVGIRDAKTIVSINQDENAFMNHAADYYLVADIKDILGELQAAVAS